MIKERVPGETPPIKEGFDVAGPPADYIERFRENLGARNYSKKTIKNYVHCIKGLTAWMSKTGIGRMQDITPEHMADYQVYLHSGYTAARNGRLSVGAQRVRLYAARTFFTFLSRRRHILGNPTSELEFPSPPRRLPRDVLTKRETKRMLAAPELSTLEGFRDRCILEMLYATGVRLSELRELTVYDVDLEAGEVRVMGKGAKERIIPVARKCCAFVKEYMRRVRPRMLKGSAHNWLWVSTKGGQKIGRDRIWMVVRKYAEKCRIKGKHITTHSFRHAIATHLLKAGADIRHIQEFLGHSSIAATQIYTQVDMTELRRVIQKAHPREQMP